MYTLALDVRVLDQNGEEIELSNLIDDDMPTAATLEEVEKAIDNPYVEEDDDEEPLDEEDYDDDYSDEGEYYDEYAESDEGESL